MAKSKSKIHIKKENRGKFTAKAKRAGMSVQEYATHVLKKREQGNASYKKAGKFR